MIKIILNYIIKTCKKKKKKEAVLEAQHFKTTAVNDLDFIM